MQLILTPPPKVIVILKEISFNCGNAIHNWAELQLKGRIYIKPSSYHAEQKLNMFGLLHFYATVKPVPKK